MVLTNIYKSPRLSITMTEYNPDEVLLVADALEGLGKALLLEAERFNLKPLNADEKNIILSGSDESMLSFIRSSQVSRTIMILLARIKDDHSIIRMNRRAADYIRNNSITFKILPVNATREACAEIGRMLEQDHSLRPRLDNYDISLGLAKNDDLLLGIMPYKKDICRRDYKIYPSRQSTSTLLYASMLEIAGAVYDEGFLDPLCQDGSFAIEYALRRNGRVRLHEEHLLEKSILSIFFDTSKASYNESELPKIYCSDEHPSSLAKARMNSRLAGIEKNISFASIPIEYLQLKHQKNSLGTIAAKLPLLSKAYDKKKYGLLLSKLLKNARIILRREGTMILVSNEKEHIIEEAKKHGFAATNVIEYEKGLSRLYGLIIRRVT